MLHFFSSPLDCSYSDSLECSHGYSTDASDFYRIDDTDRFVLEIPVVGVPRDMIDIEVSRDILNVHVRPDKDSEKHSKFRTQPFNRRFKLDDHLVVSSATTHDGILKIIFEKHVPEEEKPKKILLT